MHGTVALAFARGKRVREPLRALRCEPCLSAMTNQALPHPRAEFVVLWELNWDFLLGVELGVELVTGSKVASASTEKAREFGWRSAV